MESPKLQEIKEGSKMESNGGIKQHHLSNGKGGWLSSMLILGTCLGLNIASGAWYSNLMVFLISVFNVKNIAAAQINNIFSGLISFFPFIAAIFADSAVGSFSITLISSIVSLLPVDGEDCYLYESEDSKLIYGEPSKSLRFLNRAAFLTQGDNHITGTKTKSWNQCTVEEVEDLKKLIKIMPLWSSSILLSGAIGVIISFTVLMALVMDRRVGSHFQIPAGTFTVVTLIFTAITSSTLDRFIYPTYKKLTGRHLTYLQAISLGHVSNILAAVAFALIERRRLKLIQVYHLTDQPNAVAPLSALWLIFPLAIMGIGEGFYFSPEVALFYQEFPKSLRSTSTAMISLHIAAGFYLSSAFIDLVGRTSTWLPDDINFGRVDNACWVLAIIATVNFAYFLLCAILYKYNNPDPTLDDVDSMPS